MVSSPQKRHAAQGVVAAGMCSKRQACRYLGLARSSWAYTPRPPKPRQVQLRDGIAALAVRILGLATGARMPCFAGKG